MTTFILPTFTKFQCRQQVLYTPLKRHGKYVTNEVIGENINGIIIGISYFGHQPNGYVVSIPSYERRGVTRVCDQELQLIDKNE